MYHNSKLSLIWFVRFNLINHNNEFLNWFKEWFFIWGALEEILLLEFLPLIENFGTLMTKYYRPRMKLLYNTSPFDSIHWVIKWEYEAHANVPLLQLFLS